MLVQGSSDSQEAVRVSAAVVLRRSADDQRGPIGARKG